MHSPLEFPYLCSMRYWLILLLCLPLSLTAQRTFHAGLICGLNGAQIHGDNDWGYNQPGLYAGGFVCTNPSSKWYGQMEIAYSMKGSRRIAQPDKGIPGFAFRLNYAEVPFLVRYNMGKIYAQFGESFGFLINSKEWDNNGTTTTIVFRKWETSFIVGAGYILSERWQIDFRSVNSLLPVYKFATPFNYNRFIPNLFRRGMYNNLLTLSICYRLGGEKSE